MSAERLKGRPDRWPLFSSQIRSSPVRPSTATLVRQIASMGGDASPFAPSNVIEALKVKFAGAS
jgi:phosphopantetheine adenylyltransferase